MLLKYATSEFPALAISARITLEVWCWVLEESKGLPLETKNAEKNENQRIGFIMSLYTQQCSLQGCTCPLPTA